METMNLKDLNEKEVVTSDGHVIGKINGAIITRHGDVSSLSLMLKNDIVATLRTTPNLRQDISVKDISGITDRVMLNRPLNGLEKYLIEHNPQLDAGRLMGMEVLSGKGKPIGTVDDLMIEHGTWKVPFLRVKVNAEEEEALKVESITLAGKLIDISMGNIRNVGDMVVLNMTADYLNSILEAAPIRKD